MLLPQNITWWPWVDFSIQQRRPLCVFGRRQWLWRRGREWRLWLRPKPNATKRELHVRDPWGKARPEQKQWNPLFKKKVR